MGQEGKFFLDLFYSTFHWQKQYIRGRNLKSWPLISKQNMQRWGHPAHPPTASLICLKKHNLTPCSVCHKQNHTYKHTYILLSTYPNLKTCLVNSTTFFTNLEKLGPRERRSRSKTYTTVVRSKIFKNHDDNLFLL